MQWIYLGLDNNKNEQFTCVDDDSYELVKDLLWSITHNGMVKCVHRNNLSYLHKVVLNIKKKERIKIIHLNKNLLDNRKSNLIKKVDFTSSPPEITTTQVKDHWVAKIKHKSDQIYLGSYATQQEAIAAYMGAWYALKKQPKAPPIISPTNDEKREAIAYRFMLLKKKQKENIFEIVSRNKKPITNEKGEVFDSLREAALFYKKSSHSTLKNHLNKQTNTCWGTKWAYINPKSEP